MPVYLVLFRKAYYQPNNKISHLRNHWKRSPLKSFEVFCKLPQCIKSDKMQLFIFFLLGRTYFRLIGGLQFFECLPFVLSPL